MTTNTSPAKGLRLLRTANLMAIVATVLTIAGGVAMVIGAGVSMSAGIDTSMGVTPESLENIPLGALAATGIGGLVAIISVLFLLLSSVLQIVALVKTSGAHKSYRMALMVTLVGYILAILPLLLQSSGALSKILTIIPSACTFLSVYFVINATAALLRQRGNELLATAGIKVRNIYIVCTGITIACQLVAVIPGLAIAGGVVSSITGLVSVVALFKYVGFLKHSAMALDK